MTKSDTLDKYLRVYIKPVHIEKKFPTIYMRSNDLLALIMLRPMCLSHPEKEDDFYKYSDCLIIPDNNLLTGQFKINTDIYNWV